MESASGKVRGLGKNGYLWIQIIANLGIYPLIFRGMYVGSWVFHWASPKSSRVVCSFLMFLVKYDQIFLLFLLVRADMYACVSLKWCNPASPTTIFTGRFTTFTMRQVNTWLPRAPWWYLGDGLFHSTLQRLEAGENWGSFFPKFGSWISSEPKFHKFRFQPLVFAGVWSRMLCVR